MYARLLWTLLHVHLVFRLFSGYLLLTLLRNTSVLKPYLQLHYFKNLSCALYDYKLIWHNFLFHFIFIFHFHLFVLTPDLQRWQRSCLILSRGTSRTPGGDHTCWWRRRRPGKTFIITRQTNTQDCFPLTLPAPLFLSVAAAFMCSRCREAAISAETSGV